MCLDLDASHLALWGGRNSDIFGLDRYSMIRELAHTKFKLVLHLVIVNSHYSDT
jgi:hypothetical protein